MKRLNFFDWFDDQVHIFVKCRSPHFMVGYCIVPLTD